MCFPSRWRSTRIRRIFSDLEEREPDAFHPETGELMLGDILISMDKVREQAAEYGHSEQRELAFLVAHSMLHLMGYDHMKKRSGRRWSANRRRSSLAADMCAKDEGQHDHEREIFVDAVDGQEKRGKQVKTFDTIIAGGGPSGMAAALACLKRRSAGIARGPL